MSSSPRIHPSWTSWGTVRITGHWSRLNEPSGRDGSYIAAIYRVCFHTPPVNAVTVCAEPLSIPNFVIHRLRLEIELHFI